MPQIYRTYTIQIGKQSHTILNNTHESHNQRPVEAPNRIKTPETWPTKAVIQLSTPYYYICMYNISAIWPGSRELGEKSRLPFQSPRLINDFGKSSAAVREKRNSCTDPIVRLRETMESTTITLEGRSSWWKHDPTPPATPFLHTRQRLTTQMLIKLLYIITFGGHFEYNLDGFVMSYVRNVSTIFILYIGTCP